MAKEKTNKITNKKTSQNTIKNTNKKTDQINKNTTQNTEQEVEEKENSEILEPIDMAINNKYKVINTTFILPLLCTNVNILLNFIIKKNDY